MQIQEKAVAIYVITSTAFKSQKKWPNVEYIISKSFISLLLLLKATLGETAIEIWSQKYQND